VRPWEQNIEEMKQNTK